MSRTNHYRLWSAYESKPEREILGRRNWNRESRWPKFSMGSYHRPPPRWWWQEQHSHARAVYRQMIHHDEDPALPPEKYLIDLSGWY